MVDAACAFEFQHLEVRPLTGVLGAELFNVNLGEELSDSVIAEIREALFLYGVVGFRGQSLSYEQHVAFARRFGTLEIHPIVNGMEQHPEIIKMHKPAGQGASFGIGWHSDNSFFEAPSFGSVVYAEKVPPYGGDTLFANQQLAYAHLSPGMKRMLDGLRAVHSASVAYNSPTALEKFDGATPITFRRSDAVDATVGHDVVIRHPVTGVPALYVNPLFTQHFVDMTVEESKPLLDYLFQHAAREDFQCRFRWEPGTVAFWDNRIVQHAALDDYQSYERLLYRVTINGDRLN